MIVFAGLLGSPYAGEVPCSCCLNLDNVAAHMPITSFATWNGMMAVSWCHLQEFFCNK